VGFTSNNNAVTVLCIFNNHNNPKKVKKNKYAKKSNRVGTIVDKKSTKTSAQH